MMEFSLMPDYAMHRLIKITDRVSRSLGVE